MTSFHGRGTNYNPQNRFEERYIDVGAIRESPLLFEEEDIDGKTLKTQVFPDKTKSVLTKNDSPDIPFDYGLNPYRGCEHGCIYCYARPYHEYLGLSAGLDFETKIFAKFKAPELLRKELSSPRWQASVIAMSGITDCYQPIERHLKITRGCLEVLAEFLNPVGIISKNALVTRDMDLLQKLSEHQAVSVALSVTSLDNKLARILEPRAATPQQRLEAIATLNKAGIPAGVMVAPIIPALNDSEIPQILKVAASAGAKFAGYTLLRLPHAVEELFKNWLTQYFPERKNKILHRLQEIRGGELNEYSFGKRMKGEGIFAEQIRQLFSVFYRKNRISGKVPLSTESFRKVERQMRLF